MGLLETYTCVFSLFACFLLAFIYVSSLYVWNSPLNRDHPSVIKKRTISVIVVMIISPLITKWFMVDERFLSISGWELHGFRTAGLVQAIFLPLLLTNVLFLGPLCMQGFGGFLKLYAEPLFWLHFCDAIWLRNYIIAPFSEEFTFRACMLPLLLQCFKPMTAVFICPLFFGLAHVHHMIERLRFGMPLRNVILLAAFQFSYTTLFGAYSALLFVKTGHFVAPFLAHSFCNMMGFPDFNEVLTCRNPRKMVLIGLFVLGVVLWCLLLPPLTSHSLYSNELYLKLR